MISKHYNGPRGVFAYAAFEDINRRYFDGRLPMTLILWDITEHGALLGWCRSPRDGSPIIKLHPSLLSPAGVELPWNISLEVLGACFAYDVLLHECMHTSVNYLLGGYEALPDYRSSWTSHNNPVWIAECNRIARLLGYPDVRADTSKAQRIPDPDGATTKTGKPATVVRWVDTGNIVKENFPHCLEDREVFYRRNVLPLDLPEECRKFPGFRERVNSDVSSNPTSCNVQL